MQRRRTVVLVTGAPGSGKTTLGRGLAARLGMVFVARDEVRRELIRSALARPGSAVLPSREQGTEAFLRRVEELTAGGTDCVVEYVVRTDRPIDLDRLLACGELRVVRTHCADPLARAEARDRRDPELADPALLAATGHGSRNDLVAASVAHMRRVHEAMRTEFPVAVVDVDTDGEFDLDAIADAVS